MGKVLIGIIAKHYLKESKRPNVYIKNELKQAIFDNGAIAIGILPTREERVKVGSAIKDELTETEKEELVYQLNLCDGIILQGGGFSDEYECFVAKYCYENDIPILGICAGMNNMVRAVGGTVLKPEHLVNHNSEENYVHEIVIEPSSNFYNMIQREKLHVNSRHKCCTSDCGPLTPAAHSLDGIIEVIEDKSKQFYLAVQFHPETLYKFDKDMDKIFKYFINVCSINKDRPCVIDEEKD